MNIRNITPKFRRDDTLLAVGFSLRSEAEWTPLSVPHPVRDDSSVEWIRAVAYRMPLGMRTYLTSVAYLRHAVFSHLPPFSTELSSLRDGVNSRPFPYTRTFLHTGRCPVLFLNTGRCPVLTYIRLSALQPPPYPFAPINPLITNH